jgi:hypothetical protein
VQAAAENQPQGDQWEMLMRELHSWPIPKDRASHDLR